MSKITAITPQKKAKDRFSIFVDGKFALGLDGTLLVEYQLKVGDNYSTELQKELEAKDRIELAYSGLINFISFRERCESEVQDWLFRKGFSDLKSELIQRLKDRNYLNDERFAHMFVRDRVNLKQWGPMRLHQELAKKRISRDVIERAIETIREQFDFEAIASDLAARRLQNIPTPTLKDRKRLWSYLQRKGYDSSTIIAALSPHNFSENII